MKDEEEIKQFMRQLKMKFRKETKLIKTGATTMRDLMVNADNEDELDISPNNIEIEELVPEENKDNIPANDQGKVD